MKTPDLSFQNGHRERLRQKFVDSKITESETLELLLSYAIPRRDVRPLARGLSCRFGGMHNLLGASLDDLMAYPGCGKNTAIFIKVIHSILCMDLRDQLDKRPIFQNHEVLRNYCRMKLSNKSVEEMHLLFLGTDYKLLAEELHCTGTVDWTPTIPAEVAVRALAHRAKYVIMVHNHPSGTARFSDPDVEITALVQTALSAIDVKLLDHLLVAGNVVVSGMDSNLFHKCKTSK